MSSVTDTSKPASRPFPVEAQAKPSGSCPKRPYRSPRLIALGELLDVTMGPSPGLGESGNPAVFRSGTRSV